MRVCKFILLRMCQILNTLQNSKHNAEFMRRGSSLNEAFAKYFKQNRKTSEQGSLARASIWYIAKVFIYYENNANGWSRAKEWTKTKKTLNHCTIIVEVVQF